MLWQQAGAGTRGARRRGAGRGGGEGAPSPNLVVERSRPSARDRPCRVSEISCPGGGVGGGSLGDCHSAGAVAPSSPLGFDSRFISCPSKSFASPWPLLPSRPRSPHSVPPARGSRSPPASGSVWAHALPAPRPAPALVPGARPRRRRSRGSPAMRPRAAPRGPAAALGLCSLLLLLGPGHACPAGCACTDPHTVDCRDRGLPSVPDPFPLDVRKLLVAGNRIQRIPEDFFIFYGDLVYLDFRNNSLRSLEEGTFSGSAKLAFLDLSYNNLTQLGAGAFRSAGRLVKLSLANNRLAGVHEAAFESLESLQVLELNDNNLRGLSVAALAALPALRALRLDGNPWLCDCDFAHLFSWIQENASKLPKGEPAGLGWGLGCRVGGKETRPRRPPGPGAPAQEPREPAGGSGAALGANRSRWNPHMVPA